jgi:hypothetical protein
MFNNPFEEFISSFDESFNILISDEELELRFEKMNHWFQTLEKKEILEKAQQVQEFLMSAISYAERQKEGIGKLLVVNDKNAKANRTYSKF